MNETHALQPERWLRVDEVAKECRISETLARRLIKSGAIEHRRFGRLIRVPASALDSAQLDATR